ncbi:MAG: FxDxF family PEP-CTERM protein, partial [Nitrosomonas sp.]
NSVTFGYEYIMAVPEPETYAMLLAGLGLIGFSARRRRVA